MKFQNPLNGYIETAFGLGSFLGCLFFGCFYFLYKGNIAHAALSFLAAIMTGGISWFFYPFAVKSINEAFYRKRGWVEKR